MSYKLNGVTLPTPKELNRQLLETSKTVNTLSGGTKKDITNRKERYNLTYKYLTQAEVTTLLNIYNLEEEVLFEVDETNLTISPTYVHVDISERGYSLRGVEYREDINLVLTEVN